MVKTVMLQPIYNLNEYTNNGDLLIQNKTRNYNKLN